MAGYVPCCVFGKCCTNPLFLWIHRSRAELFVLAELFFFAKYSDFLNSAFQKGFRSSGSKYKSSTILYLHDFLFIFNDFFLLFFNFFFFFLGGGGGMCVFVLFFLLHFNLKISPFFMDLTTGILDQVLPGGQQDAGSAQAGNSGKDQLPACQFLRASRLSAPDDQTGAGGRGVDGPGLLPGAVRQPCLPAAARENFCGGAVD